MYLSISESAVLTALRQFLLGLLPEGSEVIRTQVNRVPMPTAPLFAAMTPLRRTRLATNVTSLSDIRFVASIAAEVMTVSEVISGELVVGLPLRATGLAERTTITELLTGAGSTGTYVVAPTQTFSSAEINGGVSQTLQATQYDVQLDLYGTGASDAAQLVQTVFRSAYACGKLAWFTVPLTDADGNPLYDDFGDRLTSAVRIDLAPLYTSDARDLQFVDAEQQFDLRWSMDLSMQVNPVVALPQDFADTIQITTIEVDTGAQGSATATTPDL